MAWKLPLTARQLLFELVYLVYYKPSFDRRTGEPMEAGTYRCTASFLANRLNRSVKQIRTDLKRLELAGIIGHGGGTEGARRGHGGKILTITNYRAYQGFRNGEGTEGARRGHGEGNNRIQVYKYISKDDIYMRTLQREFERYIGQWTEQNEEVAREWEEKKIPLRVAVGSIRLGAGRAKGEVISLRYFEPIFPEAEKILEESPGYFGYVTKKLEGKK